MGIVLLLLLYLIWELFSRLSRSNPFERVLFKQEYTLHAFPSCSEVTLSFTKHANVDSCRKAFFHIRYSYPDTKQLIFDNLPPYTVIPFFFERLDFSSVPYIPNRHSFLENISSGHLPCSTLILPKNIGRFWFYTGCDHLRLLDIPAQYLVPAYIAPDCVFGQHDTVTILVHSGFQIRVPRHLLKAYQEDPHWASLRFEDENGNIFPPQFFSYREF